MTKQTSNKCPGCGRKLKLVMSRVIINNPISVHRINEYKCIKGHTSHYPGKLNEKTRTRIVRKEWEKIAGATNF